MDVFVGIDPSLNSTGICILKSEDGQENTKQYFTIVKPNKLSKREQLAQEKYIFFDYALFDKYEQDSDDNHKNENIKTNNFISSLEKTIDTIKENTSNNDCVYIVQEGISYGSTLRTKSVFDLAGLNYMLRYRIKKFLNDRFLYSNYIIATPTEIKKFATGVGNAKKELLVNNFKLIFPDFDLPKIDDICDAYYMALYAKYLKEKYEET